MLLTNDSNAETEEYAENVEPLKEVHPPLYTDIMLPNDILLMVRLLIAQDVEPL